MDRSGKCGNLAARRRFWEVALRGQSRHLPVPAEVWNAAKEQGRGPGALAIAALRFQIVLDADSLIFQTIRLNAIDHFVS